MNIMAIANQKGGTAKTTTAAAFAVLLARAGVSTHLVDMDPQASLTSAFGLNDAEGELYRSLTRRAGLPVVRVAEHLTLTPASIDLSRSETEFLSQTGREFILQTCLQQTDLPPDTTVILDCPPSLGVLAVNCLAAARYVCVVVQPGGFELRTLVHLNETVDVLRQRINPELGFAGAVITNCHLRRNITDEVHAEVARHYTVLGQVRAEARLLYATTSGKVYHLVRSKALDDYRRVVDRLRGTLPWLARK